jgi:membrane fusion protein (multidrug efflux system)
MKYNNITHLLVLTIFISLLFSCESRNENVKNKGNKKILQVVGYVVDMKSFSNELSTPGTFQANDMITITSPIAGYVSNVLFKDGQVVKKGQLILQIDSRELKNKLKAAEIALETAKKDLSRKKEIKKLNGVSTEDIEQAENSVAQLEAQIEQLKIQIDYTDIKAPFAGKLGLKNISPGAYLLVGQTITNLVSNNPIKIDFEIPAEYAQMLSIGESIKVLRKSSNDSLTAKIIAFDANADESTRSIKVRALAENPNGKYLPGDYADVVLNFQNLKNSIVVPTEAVVPSLNNQLVYVVHNGIAYERNVLLGLRNDKYVQILSGLQVGDTIMVTGLVNIRNNTPVKVVKLQNNSNQRN